jgi:hypothetical protein
MIDGEGVRDCDLCGLRIDRDAADFDGAIGFNGRSGRSVFVFHVRCAPPDYLTDDCIDFDKIGAWIERKKADTLARRCEEWQSVAEALRAQLIETAEELEALRERIERVTAFGPA